MMKIAKIVTEAKPHQQRVLDRIKSQPGLVVAHNVGSGKTLASLMAAEEFGGGTDVVVPASLRANYEKEIAKHVTEPNAQYKIQSLQGLARNQEAPKQKNLIVDEAHRLRDTGTQGYQAVAKNKATKRLLLTGSPLYNKPADMAALVNLAAGERVLPTSPEEFEKAYVEITKVNPGLIGRLKGAKPGEKRTLKNTAKLREALQKWVDYHENGTEGFPERRDTVVPVPLKDRQLSTYKSVMGEAPAWAQYKIKKNLPLSKQEAKQLNSFLTGTRQLATSLGAHATDIAPAEIARQSPKITTAVQRLKERIAKDPEHRAVVYSNFLDAGITPYEAALKEDKIPYGKFTGEMTKGDRNQMVSAYNEGKLRALLLSSAGGEGLDLKGTRQIQVLEPHFNKEKLEQVIGRGIRYGSHEKLAPENRNVDVEHYVSQMPEPGRIKKFFGAKRDTSVDEYLRQLSADKDALNQQVKELMKTSAAREPVIEAFVAALKGSIAKRKSAVASTQPPFQDSMRPPTMRGPEAVWP